MNLIPMPTKEVLERQIEEGRINRLKVLEQRRHSCLSRWYPLVRERVPTPRTVIIHTHVDLEQLWDRKVPVGYEGFLEHLRNAVTDIGLPAFLRTGLTSGKHGWDRTCNLTDIELLHEHIAELVELGGMYDLPLDVWVVREMLPVEPLFTAFWGHMPIVSEFRYFVEGGKVACSHPYWPEEAIEGNDPSREGWQEALRRSYSDVTGDLRIMSEIVSAAVPGYWSVDWLKTRKGWFLIDMGQGDESYHYPGCPKQRGNR